MMNPYFNQVMLSLAAAVLLAICGCQKASGSMTSNVAGPSTQAQDVQEQTRQVAVEALGLKLEGDVTAGHQDNFSGLRTDTITFSRRLDSRTFVVYDRRFSDTQEAGMYKEADEALLKRSRVLLERLQIPTAEIASERVVQEKTQVGERDSITGTLKLEPVEPGKKWARISRQIDGVPIFSSRATFGLLQSGELGFLQVHWPEIPAETIEAARQYRELVAKNWHAPELEGARIESVTAGILHSPAAATAMDILPVIRVIYAPLGEHIGKKPVAYLDRDGKPVAMPRVFLQPPREELKTERVASQP